MSSLHYLPPPTGNKKPQTVRWVSTAQTLSPRCTQIPSLIKRHLLREATLNHPRLPQTLLPSFSARYSASVLFTAVTATDSLALLPHPREGHASYPLLCSPCREQSPAQNRCSIMVCEEMGLQVNESYRKQNILAK